MLINVALAGNGDENCDSLPHSPLPAGAGLSAGCGVGLEAGAGGDVSFGGRSGSVGIP